MNNPKPSFLLIVRRASQGGLIAAGFNISWLFILEYALSITGLPKQFPAAVVISTLLPILAGAVLYYLLAANFSKGKTLFLFIGSAFTILSLFPSFSTSMPDGTPTPNHFALLTIPMHAIAAGIGMYYTTKD